MTLIHLVIIEESEDDVGLLLQELRRGGYELAFKQVRTSAELTTALDQQAWDAVFSDYSGSHLTACIVLGILQSRGLDLPFIVVSNAIGENAMVTVMKAGAHDYIWKGDFTRLVPVLDRELRQAKIRQEKSRIAQALHENEEKYWEEIKRLNIELERRVAERTTQLEQLNAQLQADILERQCAQEALSASEHQYRTTIDSMEEAIHLVDPECRIMLANRTLQQWILEFKLKTEIVGKTILEAFPFLSISILDEYHTVFRHGQQVITEERNKVGDREIITETRKFPIIEGGRVVRAATVMRDITERKRAEQRLREQVALLDQAQDAIMITDLEGRVTHWNKSAERLYGWTASEAQGRVLEDLLVPGGTPKALASHQKVLLEKEWTGEMSQTAKGGQPILVQSRWTLIRDELGRPQSILVVNTDITLQRQWEARYLRAQRMESIGTLASGLAHDLNNVLAPILMAIQTLRDDIPDESSQLLLSTLETSALRGANIIRQLLTFGRGVEGDRVVLQPKHLIKEMAKIAQETFPKSISVKVQYPADVWAVTGDATQLHQVLLNLSVNARDAMSEGGKLIFIAENVLLDEYYAQMNPEAKPGPHVVLTVADTGLGIPALLLDKIFDPFFTTKAAGKGTGLGLATALGIVKSHGGFIQVQSEPNKGTRFKVYLPATTLEPAGELPSEDANLPIGQGELILVVEDEAPVRQITEKTLTRNGYKVLIAGDGTEAVALFAKQHHTIQAVLTDMVMPIMDGVATIRAIRRISPNIKIIAATGMTDPTQTSNLTLANVQAVLIKPFTALRLLSTLREVLAATPAVLMENETPTRTESKRIPPSAT